MSGDVRSRRLALLLGIVLMAPAVHAVAQDRPPGEPSRDVAVTYRGFSGRPLRMAWLSAERTSRLELDDGTWSVRDRRSGRGFMVIERVRTVFDTSGVDPTRLEPGPDAVFNREGTDTVAGQTCTVWRMQEGPLEARSCVTDSGVLLRQEAAGLQMVAVKVSYARQDPRRFHPPRGYRHAGATEPGHRAAPSP